ncbi:2-amino-4-hydroxy-6-hydroxymethyldihydropteridine diphosphokinase [Porticoccus sp.]|uniref:2-amino-4-hydroxy-6- hydroxymethyldihydropteridine diphosphokinase n=1 Tax=Porticoccus sp. TaxID=2024853 RepID=UPI003F69AC23
MAEITYIGLGSNLNQPLQQLQNAAIELASLPDTRLMALSSWYRSVPMGPQDQPDFINGVAKLYTSLPPRKLLAALQAIEQAHLRKKDKHWGPRTLDLDILLYGEQVIDDFDLQVPHTGIHLRNFVLLPLAEITEQLIFPDGTSLVSHLENCPSGGIVRLSSGDPFGTTD